MQKEKQILCIGISGEYNRKPFLWNESIAKINIKRKLVEPYDEKKHGSLSDVMQGKICTSKSDSKSSDEPTVSELKAQLQDKIDAEIINIERVSEVLKNRYDKTTVGQLKKDEIVEILNGFDTFKIEVNGEQSH